MDRTPWVIHPRSSDRAISPLGSAVTASAPHWIRFGGGSNSRTSRNTEVPSNRAPPDRRGTRVVMAGGNGHHRPPRRLEPSRLSPRSPLAPPPLFADVVAYHGRRPRSSWGLQRRLLGHADAPGDTPRLVLDGGQ